MLGGGGGVVIVKRMFCIASVLSNFSSVLPQQIIGQLLGSKFIRHVTAVSYSEPHMALTPVSEWLLGDTYWNKCSCTVPL